MNAQWYAGGMAGIFIKRAPGMVLTDVRSSIHHELFHGTALPCAARRQFARCWAPGGSSGARGTHGCRRGGITC